MSDVAKILIILSDAIHWSRQCDLFDCVVISHNLFYRVSVTMQLALVVDIMKILRSSSFSLTLHFKQTLTDVYHPSN